MPNRYICSVLDEMRECAKTNNYSYLTGLIEEAQSMANRMEATLWDQKRLDTLHYDIKVAKTSLEKAKKKLAKKKEVR